MKYYILALITFVMFSCKNSDNKVGSTDAHTRDEIPSCIKDIIETNKENNTEVSIKYIDVEDKRHYWINTGALAFDGSEYIMDKDCVHLCSFNGMERNPCLDVYGDKRWSTLYNKETVLE